MRETAPATPPAMKDATTGLEIVLRKLVGTAAEERSGVAAIVVLAALERACEVIGFDLLQKGQGRRKTGFECRTRQCHDGRRR